MIDDIVQKTAGTARRFGPTTLKLVWLFAIGAATLLPTHAISDLIGDRETHETEARTAIARSWGPEQVVSGPAFVIPTGNATTTRPAYVRVAPKVMEAEIDVLPERRHRGFFDVTVYAATVHVKGMFRLPDTMMAVDGTPRPLPTDGFLAMGVTNLAGVAGTDDASIGDAKGPWQVFEDAGHAGCRGSDNLLVLPSAHATAREIPFEATLHLRGTQSFAIAALAKTMNARIKGAWGSPSFIGDEPPLRSDVSKDSFAAQWHIDGIGAPGITPSACAAGPAPASRIGVDLVDPLPVYRVVTRAAKYAPLFILFAFAAYFACELVGGIAIAIPQYALMAASLSLFALLLVSLSEIIGYLPGYVASAALVTAQATIFTASVTRRIGPTLGFAAMLACLFGGLYVLLGLETFALLTGSVALFLALSAIMAATQQVYRRDAEVV